jgi:hypothetical protein
MGARLCWSLTAVLACSASLLQVAAQSPEDAQETIQDVQQLGDFFQGSGDEQFPNSRPEVCASHQLWLCPSLLLANRN